MMANSSGTVVAGSYRISWQAGSLGSKKVNAGEDEGGVEIPLPPQ